MKRYLAVIGALAVVAAAAGDVTAQATSSATVTAAAGVGPANAVSGVQNLTFGELTPADASDDVTVTIPTYDNANAGYFSVWTNRRGTTVSVSTLTDLTCVDTGGSGCDGAPDITVDYTCAWTRTATPASGDLNDHASNPGDCLANTTSFNVAPSGNTPETMFVFFGGQVTVIAADQLAGNYEGTIGITATSPAI